MIDFAKIVIAGNGKAMVAIRDAGLAIGDSFELRLHSNNSFEIMRSGENIGHVENAPQAALQALAKAPSVVLVEISPSGPTRFHEKVSVAVA